MRRKWKLFEVYPIWNHLGCLRCERSEGFQNLRCGGDPRVHSTVEQMTVNVMKQMPGEYNLGPANFPRGCSDNCIVASYVRVNNVEPFPLESRSQPHRSNEVRGVQERQFDLCLQRAVRASGNHHLVTRFSK